MSAIPCGIVKMGAILSKMRSLSMPTLAARILVNVGGDPICILQNPLKNLALFIGDLSHVSSNVTQALRIIAGRVYSRQSDHLVTS
jgi:hypothetical protein